MRRGRFVPLGESRLLHGPHSSCFFLVRIQLASAVSRRSHICAIAIQTASSELVISKTHMRLGKSRDLDGFMDGRQYVLPPCRIEMQPQSDLHDGQQGALAQATDCRATAFSAGGTQSTGTRDRASRVNAVPCGPGVSLVRFTPITSTLG
jgi:hypothetical protein